MSVIVFIGGALYYSYQIKQLEKEYRNERLKGDTTLPDKDLYSLF